MCGNSSAGRSSTTSTAERVRILHVTHNFPRWPGDRAGAFVARIAALAAARGADVRALAPHAAGATVDDVVGGVPVTRFRYAPDGLERIGYQGDVRRSLAAPVATLTLPIYLTAFRRAVRRAVRDFRPDLIHAHWWVPGGWAAAGQGPPVVISCHGSDVRLLLRSAALRILARRTFARVDHITAVSALMRADLAAVVPALEARLTTAYLPVEVDRFTLPSARTDAVPRILYAGNLIAAKGVDLILRAYARLRSAGVACTLRIVGGGVERQALAALADALGVGPLVEWGGTRAPADMPAEYAAATVTVMASRGPRGEGLPMTIVEALLAGSAVVATPAGGTIEVVQDGETGLLARDGDAIDLARQLGRMLGDPALRHATAAAGKAFCLRAFAPGPAMDRFFGIYEAALAGRR